MCRTAGAGRTGRGRLTWPGSRKGPGPGGCGRGRRKGQAPGNRPGGRSLCTCWRRELPVTADDDLARVLAVEAGRRLLARRARGGDAGDLRAAGDRLSHEFLAAELRRLRPQDAVLSEEAQDDPARLAADRVWIVDPLDGTREYGEPGRSDWAVHVALWERGELTAGAVALPAQDR